MKPIIGIISKHFDVNDKRTNLIVRDAIKDAVLFNNGIPIGIFPTTEEISLINRRNEQDIFKNLDNLLTKSQQDDLVAQINLCNGLILMGGPISDAYEIWVAKYAYENDIPIIGICAGHNNLVRGIGGTTKSLGNEDHNRPDLEYAHSIKIKNDSQFFNMTGVSEMRVNSWHNNSIDDPKMLDVVAYDDDGNIEVTENKTKKCYIGMRFHPELLYKTDKLHNNIFKKFIDICTK